MIFTADQFYKELVSPPKQETIDFVRKNGGQIKKIMGETIPFRYPYQNGCESFMPKDAVRVQEKILQEIIK